MKNKVITVYELMGLIKDGQAPKKIKYNNFILTLNEAKDDYKDECYILFLFEKFEESNNTVDFLNDTVEILPEENDEWEDIEEIENIDDFAVGNLTELNSKVINKLIKNQRKIIEKLDDNTCIRDKAELELFINERINKKMNKDIGVNNKL